VYKERGLKNTYSKKIDDSSRLYQGQDKDLLWKHREQIRKEVNALYIGGKISKTNYEKLDSSIPNDVE
jgi:hypothetical protein